MEQARPDRAEYRDKPLATLDEMTITTAGGSNFAMLILIFSLATADTCFETIQIYQDLKVNFLENPRIILNFL